MLLSFRVANHLSIKEEQQLLLAPVYDTDRPEDTDWAAVPVAAVFGANAAGKSNVVDALWYMAFMAQASLGMAKPGPGVKRHPFMLDREGPSEPSWYVVDLLLDGIRHTYGFSVDDERVRDEWLYSYPHGRKRVVFQRGDDDLTTVGDALPRREFDLIRKITEPNVLFLSVAARAGQEAVLPVYEWFARAISFQTPIGAADQASVLRQIDAALRQPGRAEQVVALLGSADLGIVGVGADVREEHVNWQFAKQHITVWVEQRGRLGPVRLGYEDQSAGTRALLAYAGPVLTALETGGLLVVDEIDSSLHPRLTAHLIHLFQESATNPRGAQLLLTTHDASLLGRSGGRDILKRDQVWFVEKDEYGETTLFPLSDFKPRQEENRERRYLGGSYGAVPMLNEELFAAAVAEREGREGTADGEDAEE
ncbi:AAA family ATPase [Streptomyces sp. DSM 40750]|uniref:AAA family ATPase n=1 Tax=Streptomyces sp. DSM 40750 TaxID=2801030 RepID=UPI00214A94CE|nr:ATP-binding protein [Streptomyces sp. DSM 40750]UUU23820.1 ATP-binding protein [Streptomyces sp. DSM 40750]